MDEAVLKEMVETLSDLGSALPESFSKLMIRRLDTLGCPPKSGFDLAFAAQKAEREILDYCHIEIIPSVLYPILCDRACGKYLYDQKQAGLLDMETLDLSGALSSITEGDVSLSFRSGMSDAEKLDELLGRMMEAGEGQLACYRKIRWQ